MPDFASVHLFSASRLWSSALAATDTVPTGPVPTPMLRPFPRLPHHAAGTLGHTDRALPPTPTVGNEQTADYQTLFQNQPLTHANHVDGHRAKNGCFCMPLCPQLFNKGWEPSGSAGV